MRQPGEVDFDASVAKDFKVFESMRFQIRFDAFNVINHTNFTAPSGSVLLDLYGGHSAVKRGSKLYQFHGLRPD